MRRVRKRGRPTAETPSKREAILHAARAAFAKSGFAGANLREIAARADADVALISHHFGSKLDLWKAVIDTMGAEFEDWSREVRRATPAEDARRPLAVLVVDFIRHASKTPDLGLLLAFEVGQPGERADYIYDRVISLHRAAFLPAIREAIARGEIPEQDPEFCFTVLMASISMPLALSPLVTRHTGMAIDQEHFTSELSRSVTALFGLDANAR
jgi:AcrR family transcriptional regulator